MELLVLFGLSGHVSDFRTLGFRTADPEEFGNESLNEKRVFQNFCSVNYVLLQNSRHVAK